MNTESITFEKFCKQLDQRPFPLRLMESVGNYALNQYRISNAEMCCGNRFKGRLRLAWAACCSPRRTLMRIGRIVGFGTRNS